MTQSATETNQIKDRNNNVLSLAQVDAFQRNGYHFPLRALSAEQALAYRKRLETSESSGRRRIAWLVTGEAASAVHLGKRADQTAESHRRR